MHYTLYSRGRQPMASRANCGPFQILRSKKKGYQKKLGEMAKKYELMALNKKGF